MGKREWQKQAEFELKLKKAAGDFGAAKRERLLIDDLGRGLMANLITPEDFQTEGLVYLMVLTFDHLERHIWDALRHRSDLTMSQINYLHLMVRIPKVKEEVEGLRLARLHQSRMVTGYPAPSAVSAIG